MDVFIYSDYFKNVKHVLGCWLESGWFRHLSEDQQSILQLVIHNLDVAWRHVSIVVVIWGCCLLGHWV